MREQLPKMFPQSLLDSTPNERLDYFESRRCNHPILQEKVEETLYKIENSPPETIIFVYGPSHVGKSKLSTIIEERLKEKVNQKMDGPVLVEIVPPQTNGSIWKDFYIRLLTAMDEPLIDKKVLYTDNKIITSGFGRNGDALQLRRSVENCLRNNNPAALLLDEAQHFTKIPANRSVLDQTDNLKSLINSTTVPIVLFGTYELLEMRDLSDQLINRGVDVHFPRYHYENEKEREAFKKLLLTYEQHLPLREESNLIQYFDFCYERTIGCGGALHKLLYKALSYALCDQNPKEMITKIHLGKAALSAPRAKKLLEFVKQGEKELWKKIKQRQQNPCVFN
ncbi:ATP-binding protein [Paenibacillus sp. CC-CFT747]|nr:ATP-binding protein [Paenibacillus sp. CC-CFT747]